MQDFFSCANTHEKVIYPHTPERSHRRSRPAKRKHLEDKGVDQSGIVVWRERERERERERLSRERERGRRTHVGEPIEREGQPKRQNEKRAEKRAITVAPFTCRSLSRP